MLPNDGKQSRIGSRFGLFSLCVLVILCAAMGIFFVPKVCDSIRNLPVVSSNVHTNLCGSGSCACCSCDQICCKCLDCRSSPVDSDTGMDSSSKPDDGSDDPNRVTPVVPDDSTSGTLEGSDGNSTPDSTDFTDSVEYDRKPIFGKG